jgi:hypothetical protein
MTRRILALGLTLYFIAPSWSAEPLPERIDKLIAAKAKENKISLAAKADDAEFLRRVWLDLAGCIPSAAVTKEFLADKSADKREKMIDKLLASPDYTTTMAQKFHLHFMERLGDHAEWSKYLKASFAANKPWDAMVREMLRANYADEANRGATFFLSKRLENYGQNAVDYSALTRDVGRLFLGKNFQCCECHDHLFIDEYKQQDFQGLYAFFKNAVLVPGEKERVGEKPTLEKTKFASVFAKVEMLTAPALPGGSMVELPAFKPGEEYAEKPDRKTKTFGVPKFSTLQSISEQLPTAKNKAFVRNSANRIWFLLMGRGLVHPLDLDHAGNPASHPELLDLLSEEFARSKFDIKAFVRGIALSETYQRSSIWNGKDEPPHAKHFATAAEKRLSGEQLYASILEATGSKPTAGLEAKFVKAYANQPREPEDEIEPSLRAALFLLHDSAFLALLKPQDGNLAERLKKLESKGIADELYLSILSRKPSAQESAVVTKVLTKAGEKKPEAIGRLIWALLASMEFGVNH